MICGNKVLIKSIIAVGYLLLSMIILPLLSAQDLLTLSKALETASVHSPDLQQSALSLECSQESLKAQKASLKSDFSLSLTPLDYSNVLKYDDLPDGDGWYNVEQTTSGASFSVSQPILLTDATIGLSNSFQWQNINGDKSFYNNLSILLNQPLFTHNEQKMALKEVELEVEDAAIDYALQKLSMESSITEAFYSIYQKQIKVVIYSDELKNQKDSHSIIKKKVEAGLLSLEELYQSEVNLISSKTSLEEAQLNLENATDEFRVLIGVDFDYDFIAVIDIQVDSVPVDISKAIERSLLVTRELRQRMIDIENAKFDLISTKDNYDLSGNLSLQFGIAGQDESLSNIYNTPTNSTGIELSLEIPVWDWGKRKAKVRYSEISLEKQELYLQDEKKNIILTIRKIYRNLSYQLRQIKMTGQNVINAQLTYDTNFIRYQKGQITALDLQLLQDQLSQAKTAQTQAIINYKLELLDMKIQTLYDWEKKEEFLPENIFNK